MKKEYREISSCCGKHAYVQGSDEGTCYYVCENCNKPCDITLISSNSISPALTKTDVKNTDETITDISKSIPYDFICGMLLHEMKHAYLTGAAHERQGITNVNNPQEAINFRYTQCSNEILKILQQD